MRGRIDEIDERIQSLINERARFAQQVGVSKGELASAVDYYRPEREAEVLRKIQARNKGPIRDEEMLRLFREIMSACLAQQEPLKVGFLGPEGTFTQTAVFKHFGHSVRALPFHTIDEIFHEVESGIADFGVVPIENSTEGSVNYTLDMFLTSPLKIAGEIELRIEQQRALGQADIGPRTSGAATAIGLGLRQIFGVLAGTLLLVRFDRRLDAGDRLGQLLDGDDALVGRLLAHELHHALGHIAEHDDVARSR